MSSITTVTDNVDPITAARINVLARALASICGVTDDGQSGIVIPVDYTLELENVLTAIWQDGTVDGPLKFKDALGSAELADLGGEAMPIPVSLGEMHHGFQQGGVSATVNRIYLFPVQAPVDMTVEGIRFRLSGTVAGGNIIAGLYSDGATLTKVADTGTYSLNKSADDYTVPFSSSYEATKGIYWLALICDTATSNLSAYRVYDYIKYYDPGSFTLPASFSKPAGWLASNQAPGCVGVVTGGIY